MAWLPAHLGDDTAERAGRLTLNPISHVDPVRDHHPAGDPAVYFHLPVFGWAKPVPVDFRRLRNGRTGMVMVAAAGPLTNLTLAIASAFYRSRAAAAHRSPGVARGRDPAGLHVAGFGHN